MPAKKPQDHLDKHADTHAEPERRAVEVQGLALFIDEAALDDFELIGDLRKLDSGTSEAALVMPDVLKALLGAEQYRQAMNHLRGDNGRVGIEAGAKFVGDLLKALNPN